MTREIYDFELESKMLKCVAITMHKVISIQNRCEITFFYLLLSVYTFL